MTASITKKAFVVDHQGTAGRLYDSGLHRAIQLETFRTPSDLLAALKQLRPAERRQVGAVVIEREVPKYRNNILLAAAHPDARESGIPVAREVAQLVAGDPGWRPKLAVHTPEGQSAVVNKVSRTPPSVIPSSKSEKELKAFIEKACLRGKDRPRAAAPQELALSVGLESADYERALYESLDSRRPPTTLMQQMVGRDGLAKAGNDDGFEVLARKAKVSPHSVRHMRHGVQQIGPAVAKAAIETAHVPAVLRPEYFETLVGIPSVSTLVRRLGEKDPNPYRDVHAVGEEMTRLTSHDRHHPPHIGQVAGLARIALGKRQDQLGMSQTTVSDFENGKKSLSHETARRYCELLGLGGDDRRQFTLLAGGRPVLSSAQLLRGFGKADWLETLFDQTGLPRRELAVRLRAAHLTTLHDWGRKAYVTIDGVGARLAPLVGLGGTDAELFAREFSRHYDYFTREPLELLNAVKAGEMDRETALLGLLQMTRQPYKDLLPTLGIGRGSLGRSLVGHSALPAALPTLSQLLHRHYPRTHRRALTHELRLTFDSSWSQRPGSYEQLRLEMTRRAEQLATDYLDRTGKSPRPVLARARQTAANAQVGGFRYRANRR